MRTNAISIANYFIDKANENREGRHPFTLLRLVKYVYIAYGFGMAILDKKLSMNVLIRSRRGNTVQ